MFEETDKILECVPNFSEGNNLETIAQITSAIESVAKVKLLHTDIGKATNRSVFTFIGTPDEVVEAAFRAIKVASELIDMQNHRGIHPRMGATDVCPFIPVANMTIDEADNAAKKLSKKVGEELGIPVYNYEYSSNRDYRRKLEQIRHGQYEGLRTKLNIPGWEPDFGPRTFNAKSGASIIGARNFLVAYNINLDTKSVKIAQRIAEEIRESGRFTSDLFTGEMKRVPGLLKNVKAIGWYIADFDMVQVSINLTNYKVMPLHKIFETVKERAKTHETSVTGSELIGLIPSEVLIDAGKFYTVHHGHSRASSANELIQCAIEHLNLNQVKPFDPQKNIIENVAGIKVL